MGQPQGHPQAELEGTGTGSLVPQGGGMGSQCSPCGPHLRLSLFIHPVDLASDEHADLAFAPSLLAVQEIRDEEGEAWQGRSPGAKRKGLRTEPPVSFHPTLPQQNPPLSGRELLSHGGACQTKPVHWAGWCLFACLTLYFSELSLFGLFEARFYYVAEAGFELSIFLPLPPK